MIFVESEYWCPVWLCESGCRGSEVEEEVFLMRRL